MAKTVRYVALLRGINVGGNNTVGMPKLKALFEKLGYTNVSTYINSGNIVFDSPKSSAMLTEEIEAGIQKQFRLPIRIVLRDLKNLQKLCKEIPSAWKNDTEQRTNVLFLWDAFDKKSTLDLIVRNPEVDHLVYVSGAIVWNFKRVDYGKTGMRKFIGTKVYKHMTARNINTVRKLRGM